MVGTAYDGASYTKWFDADTPTGTIGVDGTVAGAPGTQFVFTKWGEDSSTDNPRASSTMTGAMTFTADYKTQFYLTVDTNPTEVLTLNPSAVSGQGWYDSETTATVDAVQNVDQVLGQSRYDFRSWTEAPPTGTPNQATVLMDTAKTATANYQLQYKVHVEWAGLDADAAGTVVTVTVGGTDNVMNAGSSFFDAWVDSGTAVSYTFEDLVSGSAGKRYRLDTVTGDINGSTHPRFRFNLRRDLRSRPLQDPMASVLRRI